jgi:hypothetical protein
VRLRSVFFGRKTHQADAIRISYFTVAGHTTQRSPALKTSRVKKEAVQPPVTSCGCRRNGYGRPNRTKALAEGAWGDTRMVGWGNTMMSDGLVARMAWIGCEDSVDWL